MLFTSDKGHLELNPYMQSFVVSLQTANVNALDFWLKIIMIFWLIPK